VQERYQFSAFGLREITDADWVEQGSSSYDFDFGFHGQFLDDETGYYNYGYRYYSPQIGRWLSQDPIEEAGGVDLYGVVGNNVANDLDYLGLLRFGCGPCPDGTSETSELTQKEDFDYTTGTDNMCTGAPQWFLSACQKHDRCYTICGVEKEHCDRNFLSDMYEICNKQGSVEARFLCKKSADVHWLAVSLAGDADFHGGGFSELQERACECICHCGHAELKEI